MKTAIPSSKATIVLLLDSLPGEGSERADCQITETVRHTLAAVTDRFAAFEAQALDVHVAFPLFQHLVLPISSGKTKISGIKLQDARIFA